ncbi:MAG: D-alanyl-D-alanine carboxypeptidase/D-alanyl-D-alanine-endopeptidase [Spirochaetes bacterium]|nr:D-alanyl-D-alanine carboxypeptidase/D-alanyl-D-alanine-endopeptidase [Spirochaetota bacterium]
MRAIAGISIVLCLFLWGCKREPTPVTLTLGPDSSEDGRDLITRLGIPPDRLGYIVYDPERNEVIQSHNRDVPFIPASVTKILTILAALDILGPDFRFETSLMATGTISGGRLSGNLYLLGTGDPLITMADLMDMASRLRALGVREVTGDFCYDESGLYRTDMIDPTMDDDASYNPGISALSMEYNTFLARWEPDRKDRDLMKITIIPDMPFYDTGIAEESPGKYTPFKLVRRAGGRERWLLSPEKDRAGSTRLPVHDPGIFTAHMFRKACGLHGILLKEPRAGTTPAGARSLVVNRGRPLRQLADITLTYSTNILAELILLATAKRLAGRPLSLRESGAVVSRYLQTRVDGIDWSGLRLENGSGLTSGNEITPSQMLGMLHYADTRDFEGRSFLSLLPASGWEWAMFDRLYAPETAFHIWAKIGAINYAVGLAGYLFTSSQRRLIFAFFITDRERRAAFEREPDRRDSTVRGRAYWWNERMTDAMDSFLEYWISRY